MTHGSLFSGVGGFDLAAEWMGWENLFHCEINEWCQKVLRFHFPKSIQYDDITRTDFTPWRGKVDVLTGGFPCQPFSTAGKRRGADSKQQGLPEAAYKGLLPTPKANSWKTPCEHGEGSPDLQTYIAKKIGETSQLNPLFVEDMMGYPLMWTTLPFLSQNGDKNP